jgi:hypothetical protein
LQKFRIFLILPSRVLDVRRISQIKKNETGSAGIVARLGSNHVSKVSFWVGHDVVNTAKRQVVPERCQVFVGVECHRTLPVINIQKLLQIKDLDTVAWLLGTDNNVVLEGSNLSPPTRGNSSRLRKAT